MNRPKHKYVMFVDNPIIVQPIKNGIDVNWTVVFLPMVCIKTPDSSAPSGFDITPKLAVTNEKSRVKIIYQGGYIYIYKYIFFKNNFYYLNSFTIIRFQGVALLFYNCYIIVKFLTYEFENNILSRYVLLLFFNSIVLRI